MFALLITVIIAIIVGQAVIFVKLNKKITEFKEVFKYEYSKTSYNTIVYSNKANNTFKTIVECINSYITNNGNRANDYHLMQDIVERNCDSKEEEIQSQIPTTLYLGLIGTMLGIIIGISELFSGGGLSELLAGTVKTDAIENMLKGVAVAMIASAAGITCTTILTFIFKNAKAKNADEKNLFLSWIQANLLPSMTSDVNNALDKMSTALSQFNEQFADNTQKLNDTLSLVAETTENQAELYRIINELDIAEMAKANVKVYKALKDSAEEITFLAQMLHASQEYVAEVRALNANLDKSEQRTKMFEEMGKYFESQNDVVGKRTEMLIDSIENSNNEFEGEFNKFVGKYEAKADKVVDDISMKFENQNTELTKLAAKQEEIIKGSDLSSLPLKMKTLDEKISHLEQLVNKTEGNIIGAVSNIKVEAPVVSQPPESKPNYISIGLWAVVIILSQIISAKMEYTLVKGIVFNLTFWTGIIGVIVSFVRRK